MVRQIPILPPEDLLLTYDFISIALRSYRKTIQLIDIARSHYLLRRQLCDVGQITFYLRS